MKQQPKFRKFNKPHHPKFRKNVIRQKALTQASQVFVLVAKQPRLVNMNQIEAARRAIVRSVRKLPARLLIRAFPSHPKTSLPSETRMGGRKRGVDQWVAIVQNRRIVFELSGISEKVARAAFKAAQFKLSGSHQVETRLKD